MIRIEENGTQKSNKKTGGIMLVRGMLGRIKSFFIGVICGVLALTLITSYIHGIKAVDALKSFFSREYSIEKHDLTLEDHGIFGYKAADFAEAVLGKEEELKKLEVYSREVTDVATLTEAGLFNIKAFSKYQYITYHGTAVYTVDLSSLSAENIALDEDTKTVTITVPDVVLEPINIPADKIEFGDVEKNTVFAFGEIKLTPEEQAEVEKEAENRMMEKLEAENAKADAEAAAEHSIWEIFQPVISGVSPEYTLKIVIEK